MTYRIAGLLPCPFCGAQAWDVAEFPYGWTGDHAYMATCPRCHVQVVGESGHRTRQAGLAALKRAVNRREQRVSAASPAG